MDVTSINLGKTTRDELATYRDQNGYNNYNEAVAALLQHAQPGEKE